MHRRDFLQKSAAALAGVAALPGGLRAAAPGPDATLFDSYALSLLEGFVRNARRTAPGYAVCDYPGGTLVGGCITPSGKTYVSVARMLPLLSEWLGAGKPAVLEVEGERVDLREVAVSIFRHAFDPAFPHYWGEPPADRKTQRSVEASLVADGLWRMRELVLGQLTPAERARVQKWLASCTQVPERDTNHAWFHCVNQAARLRLSERWSEFSGDEAWMRADLEALDALYGPEGRDGWYSDSPAMPIYDYYNFWTFGNFPLIWSGIAGVRWPEWDARLRERVRLFLQKAPYFFAADGSQPWFGRSLLYRWATLSPLLLGYRQGAWPHSPGLLRRIVRLSLQYHWRLGAFDPATGKLRETFSAAGSRGVRESYIDNGSPSWATLGLLMYGIPAGDLFWTAPEEPLPVERGDFQLRFEGARMLLLGARASGQVRWVQARNAPKFPRYRDLYTKLSTLSHFPPNLVHDEANAPWDATLVLRDRASGRCAARLGVLAGELTPDGVRTRWWTELNGQRVEVESTLRFQGEFELRTHRLAAPAALAAGQVDVLEGSHALGLEAGEEPMVAGEGKWRSLRSPRSGRLVASWRVGGYDTMEITKDFQGLKEPVNLVAARMALHTLRTPLREKLELTSLHYASPRPLQRAVLLRTAQALLARWSPAAAPATHALDPQEQR